MKTVSIDQIRGSFGRSYDFDWRFNPLQQHIRSRWVQIALARLQQVPLDPILLFKVGSNYYVQDGHHRLSVARALGEKYIDADLFIAK